MAVAKKKISKRGVRSAPGDGRYAPEDGGYLVRAPIRGMRISTVGRFVCIECLADKPNVTEDGRRQFLNNGLWLACKTCHGRRLLARALDTGRLGMHVHSTIEARPLAVGDWGETFRFEPLLEVVGEPWIGNVGVKWRFFFVGPDKLMWQGVWNASETRLRKNYNTFAWCRRLTDKEQLAFLQKD